jgi:uncharacterized membrane protein (DUF2068 family)/ABC-type branched-subunit amino acid transport system ATPase component
MVPVLAAGVGVRHGWTWVLRTASFRMDVPLTGRPAIGIATGRDGAGAAVVDLLAGLARPAYGELRVLGQDLTTPQGRAAVRRSVGIARRSTRSQPGFRVRGLVGHAARLARLPGCDRDALAAAILDRLCLTPWADVPLRAAPAVIGRRARLAAAAVHEPELLLIDGLLDNLGPRDTASVAAGIRDLGRDTAIIAIGRDRAALALACDEVLTLADGIIIGLPAIDQRADRCPEPDAATRCRGDMRDRCHRLPYVNWSLLACAIRGHFTYAPEEPGLRARLHASLAPGEAWRCLRCGTFVTGPPSGSGPTAEAPAVRRENELRSAFILRFFAVERFARVIVFGVIAYFLWRFKSSRNSFEQAFNRELPVVRSTLRALGFNVNHSKLIGLIQHAFTLNQRTLTWLAFGVTALALVELIEGIGLWLLKRWGEYFAMVATSAFIPYEVYDLALKITPLRLGAFVVNIALVLYLVLTKRLFGVRGGKKAYHARLRSVSIIDSELAAMEELALAATEHDSGEGAAVGAPPAGGPAQAAAGPARGTPGPGAGSG